MMRITIFSLLVISNLFIQCKKAPDKNQFDSKSVLDNSITTRQNQSADEERAYKDFFRRVQADEPYLGFFAAEKKCITNLDEAYEQARRQLFIGIRTCKDDPNEFINNFMAFCTENNYLDNGCDEEWRTKLVILSYEHYANMPMFEFTPKSVRHIPDLVYAKYPNKELKLDLFLPEKLGDTPVPCVVCIHGGGWVVNKKIWFEPCAAYLAEKGMAAVTIDYRLMPAVKMVDCIHDVKAAVRWVRAHAEEYNIDPDRMGAMGGSAGAHLAAVLATTSDISELEGRGGNPNYSTAIQAGVGFATPAFKLDSTTVERLKRYNMSVEELKLISPYENISSASAPFFFIHGTADKVVNPNDSENMANKYQAVGVYTELKWILDAGHVFYDGEMAMELATDFFRNIFNLKVSSNIP